MSRRSKSFFGTESAQFSELYDPFNVLGPDGKGTGINSLSGLPSLFEPGSAKDDQLRLSMFHRANPTIPWTPANYGAKGSKEITGLPNQRTSDAIVSYLKFRFGPNVTAAKREDFVAALKKDTPYADDLSVAGLYADDIQGYEAAANLPPLAPAPGLPAMRTPRPSSKPGIVKPGLTKIPAKISAPAPKRPSFAMPASQTKQPSTMAWATEVPATSKPLYTEAPPGQPSKMTWATEVPATSKPLYTEVAPPAPVSTVRPGASPLYAAPTAAPQQGIVLAETTPIYHTAAPPSPVPAIQDASLYAAAPRAQVEQPVLLQEPQELSYMPEMATRELTFRTEDAAAKEAEAGSDKAPMINKILIGAGVAAAAGAVYYFGFRKKSS